MKHGKAMARFKTFCYRVYNYLGTHLAFILAFIVTYFLGSLMVAIVSVMTKEVNVEEDFKTAKLFLEFLTPTTLAYVLTNAMTYVMETKENRKAVASWFLIIFTFGYIFAYIFYEINCNKIFMVAIMSVYTGLLLILNVLAYGEYRFGTKHKHSISADCDV